MQLIIRVVLIDADTQRIHAVMKLLLNVFSNLGIPYFTTIIREYNSTIYYVVLGKVKPEVLISNNVDILVSMESLEVLRALGFLKLNGKVLLFPDKVSLPSEVKQYLVYPNMRLIINIIDNYGADLYMVNTQKKLKSEEYAMIILGFISAIMKISKEDLLKVLRNEKFYNEQLFDMGYELIS